MYRIVVSDLDETLLRLDRTISPADREAIQRFRAMGGKFVPASGRGYTSVDTTLRDLDLYDAPGEYVISFNGGAITENRGHRMLHFQGIPFQAAEELYRRGQQYDVCVHVYTREMVYAWNLVQEEVDYLAGRMEIQEVFDRNLDFLRGQELVKCLYMNTDHAYLERIARDLEDITGDMDVSYSANRYLEFNQRGVNKGDGLRRLADLLGVDMRDTIAIGDNYNDLSMIEAAGLGACVGNAVDVVKAASGYVAHGTCDESGVAEILEKFVFSKS